MTLVETRPSVVGTTAYAQVDEAANLRVQNAQLTETVDLLHESLMGSLSESTIGLELEDRGWYAFTAQMAQEFTGPGRTHLVEVCRMMSIAHPLLKRGLTVRAGYIWGQGVEVTARVPGNDGKADPVLQDEVNQVLDGFEKLNENTFTGMGAREENERALGTDGEVFLALFTDIAAGVVKVRTVPQLQIRQIVTNPEDADEPWFYVREYTVAQLPKEGQSLDSPPTKLERCIYPALGFDPRQAGMGFKPRKLNGMDVMWDAPMVHLPVNRLDGWSRGIPDVYASVAWARLYQEFLVDWASLTKSLSKIAFKATGSTKGRAQQVATAARQSLGRDNARAVGLGVMPGTGTDAGGTAAMGPGVNFEAVSKSGATIDSDSGRPLASMIAAGVGLPVTVLLADPTTTGARAVAETLDTPTILEMGMRRLLWEALLHRVYQYQIRVAGMKPGSKLRSLSGDNAPVLEFSWPPLAGLDTMKLVTAIVAADTTETMPPLTTLRLLLSALGVPSVDEVLAEVTDEAGNFKAPQGAPASARMTAGQAAVDAARRGEDPADATR